MSPRSAANSNWVPLGGRREVARTQILAAAALCTAMDTRKTTTHMKAPLPGHLETSPSEAHARGCGPVGLTGYKRDLIGHSHSTIWGEGFPSCWGGIKFGICAMWARSMRLNHPSQDKYEPGSDFG